ncbi:MAG: ABC transporter permease [Rhodospirillaceae bacterium]|jgi:peptide/nickel transport system permease protein|nr:ABC transporter permease [Rhodospirillaceae bacterium]MBT5243937.1 ABC transporter permease [Rhodospirillaceae bacterium]MBT5562986.1 ABC transporter permease [Rhodospirillaceae bacterium]MBT6241385.1 ABC transporter permease [Rhodospirillaceae bacterium]MBT7139040.1 ABC transporter permease [Rhodospirillaceae bacterium]
MSQKLAHFVSEAPFDPDHDEILELSSSKLHMASQWTIIWWRFKRHKIAMLALLFLVPSYFSIIITEFLAPYDLHSRHTDYIFAPPHEVHLFDNGKFLGPFVYASDMKLNMDTLKREYSEDTSKPQQIRFFCSGDTYQFWGLIPGNIHLICPPEDGEMFLLGTDRLGRDMASRLLYGGRVSLTVGILGITVSFVLGLFFGGLAGYLGGWVDYTVQRMIEILRSLPELPMWLALSAALPVTWSPILVYFGITLILGLLDWPGLARAVRSKLLALREEDYCVAAQLMGAKPKRIIARHLLPNFMSHLIASATLSIPSMILAETALSFLGLGLRPPITSWGVLLSEAQNIEAVALYPWLMLPMVPVIIIVLGFNYLGDGLRDAVDPHE